MYNEEYIDILVKLCNIYICKSIIDEKERIDYVMEDDFVTFFYNSKIISSTRIQNSIEEFLKIFTHIAKSISHKRNPDIDIENYVFGWIN